VYVIKLLEDKLKTGICAVVWYNHMLLNNNVSVEEVR